MKSILILLILMPSITVAQSDTLNRDLSFYPLKTGDYWEYLTITNDNGPPPKTDTSAYSVQVMGDTTLRNGLRYAILSYRCLFPAQNSFYFFERIDSTTGCVFRFDSTSPNFERRVDSVFAQPGDFFWSSPKRPGLTYASAGFRTTCGQTVNDTVLGLPTISKFFYDQSPMESGYTLSKGLGLEWLFWYWDYGWDSGIQNNMLVYARINGTEFGVKIPTSVIDRPRPPIGFSLSQNYPNPFNPSTVIRYQLQSDVHVSLTIIDVLGRHVRTLVDGKQNAGQHSVTFDAADLPTGVYFYRLQVGSSVQTKKLMVLK